MKRFIRWLRSSPSRCWLSGHEYVREMEWPSRYTGRLCCLYCGKRVRPRD